jgi:transposase
MNVTTIGVDLAKNSFSLHGVDSRGKMVFRKTLARAKLRPFLAQQPPCLIGIEACSGAHYWGREMTQHGHRVCHPAVVSTLQYRLLL